MRRDLATKTDIKAEIAELKTDLRKFAIGAVVGVAVLDATLTYAIIRIAVP